MTDQAMAERGGGPKRCKAARARLHSLRRGEFLPAADDDVARLHGLAAEKPAVLGRLRHPGADRGDRLRPGAAQPLEPALLRRHRAAQRAGFPNQLMVFAYIAGVLLLLNIAQGWLNRYLHIKLREGLVRDLFDEWMRPGRALQAEEIRRARRQPRPAPARGRLAPRRPLGRSRHRPHAGERAARRASSASCGRSRKVSCSTMTATASPSPATWCGPALAYAGVASGISWLLGRPLIRLNADHYAREADMRAALVRASDGIGDIATAKRRGRGEGQADRRTSRR